MDGEPQTPLLEIKDLTVRFYTSDGVVKAVNGVSYQLDEGDTLGVVGESGCGKSVHARSIMRLIPIPPGRIERGEIWFDGRDLLKLPKNDMYQIRGSEIAMVFQDPMTFLNPVLTVGFQIVEALRLHQHMNKSEAYEKAGELLSLVGIPEATQRLDDYPHQFSGGMRQRAMIAMSLSCNPRLLIADEPTTALDVTIQAQIVDLVKRLQSQMGMAVMWITHDLGVAASLVKKVNVMYAGYLIERGSAKDIFKRPLHPYTQGLLGSIPRLDQKPGSTLVSIPGNPPSLINMPKGCPFVPRCLYVAEQCREVNPTLELTNKKDRSVACWQWQHVAELLHAE
ncbi:MAG: ABC transporter ATP-binding protein [Anaerolineaceae bacterium]|nr:ABC transporter ATP-binding protein [Anaerolineaceae bacterium]